VGAISPLGRVKLDSGSVVELAQPQSMIAASASASITARNFAIFLMSSSLKFGRPDTGARLPKCVLPRILPAGSEERAGIHRIPVQRSYYTTPESV